MQSWRPGGNLSYDPQLSFKELGIVMHFYHQNTVEMKTGRFVGIASKLVFQNQRTPSSVEEPISNNHRILDFDVYSTHPIQRQLP